MRSYKKRALVRAAQTELCQGPTWEACYHAFLLQRPEILRFSEPQGDADVAGSWTILQERGFRAHSAQTGQITCILKTGLRDSKGPAAFALNERQLQLLVSANLMLPETDVPRRPCG